MEEAAHCTSNLNWEGPATRTKLDDQEDDPEEASDIAKRDSQEHHDKGTCKRKEPSIDQSCP